MCSSRTKNKNDEIAVEYASRTFTHDQLLENRIRSRLRAQRQRQLERQYDVFRQYFEATRELHEDLEAWVIDWQSFQDQTTNAADVEVQS